MEAQEKQLQLPAIFGDNMVLQQNSDANFWGKAAPGEKVFIETSWNEKAEATADADGKWLTALKTPSPGGPFTVELKSGDEEILLKNVLSGEVWLCSGQSNMEMPIEGWPPNDLIDNSEETINNAANPGIRFFTVGKKIAVEPKKDCTGSWEESTPAAAAKFSATAYFFGKHLYDELDIPIGLIHSSWGGTPAESWTSDKYLNDLPGYSETLKKMKNSKAEVDKLESWLEALPQIDIEKREGDNQWANLDFNDAECREVDFDDSGWPEMNLPDYWESSELGNFDGVVWFRKKVKIPESWVGKDLVVELGPIDDMDVTFVNGVKVGDYEKAGHWRTERVYNIPKELIQNEDVTIAVRVIDNQGGGGIYGSEEQMNLHMPNSDEKISIAGSWKYVPVGEYAGSKFFIYGAGELYKQRPVLSVDISSNTPTVLYNGMIAPLIPLTIKGAIWYQGESNAGRPEEYKKLFPTMIKNWRDDFGINFPFYYVQIAPYDYGEDTESQFLREAQMLTLSVPNTGMAVTLDIGNANNIHPGQKAEVGNRLAFWALAKNYGKDIDFSGPIYKSFETKDNQIIVSFDYAGSGLEIRNSGDNNNFLIAGEDKVFKKADVKTNGDKLVLSNPGIENPVAARYAWSNTSEATLFNKEGLPASSFRTDTWSE
jgi:sialate O-acetylesterase